LVELTFREVNAIRSVEGFVENAGIMSRSFPTSKNISELEVEIHNS
jgi:hypothetical protein